jgi:uncharacterized protein (UPF0261 family)
MGVPGSIVAASMHADESSGSKSFNGGVSMIDKPGQPFYDKKADEALFSVLEGVLRHRRYRTR